MLVRTCLLTLCSSLAMAGEAYSWQQPHATVLPNGNLEWAPKPYQFPGGKVQRFIDYANGDDAGPGTREKPWKHHPWDAAAEGQAKQAGGPATYVFKGGVVYRGHLTARESGTAADPIHLCSDPGWGQGPAELYGSSPIAGGWKRCAGPEDAPGIPEPQRVWYHDVPAGFDTNKGDLQFSSMWMVQADGATSRLHLARDPNWSESDPNDPTKDWYHWQAFKGTMGNGFLQDQRWKGKPAKFFEGAVLNTQHGGLMGTPHRMPIKEFVPGEGAIKVNSPGGATYVKGGSTGKDYRKITTPVRYFIENLPAFLDAPGEYVHDHGRNRVFIRLPEGADPNTMRFEVGTRRFAIEIRDLSHITISGLTFRFNDEDDGTYGYPNQIGASPMVRAVGSCTHLAVRNCRFIDVINAVVAFPRPNSGSSGPASVWSKELGPWNQDLMTDIEITDNEVMNASNIGSIWCVGNGKGNDDDEGVGILKRVKVLRNKVVNTGFRPDTPTSSCPAIAVTICEETEIAGNIVKRSFGNGVFTVSGKGTASGADQPLIRTLIHHNQCDDTMLGCNDYGGIELFQCGPAYIYDNISRNTVGTRTFTGRELGYNLYLDGGFKIYVFNNILAGRYGDGDYHGHCGYFMVFGFMDQLFNNTITRFEYCVNGSSGNRSNVLGNIFSEGGTTFLGQNRPGDVSMLGGGDTGAAGASGIPTMAYSSNVFFGTPKGGKDLGSFGFVGGTQQPGQDKPPVYSGNTLDELQKALEGLGCRLGDLGTHVAEPPLRDPAKSDYRPTEQAKDRGVRYFVPWSLAAMVGEWNFYQHRTNPGLVLGEGFYASEELFNRKQYYHVPRMDLTVAGAKPEDYIPGQLEDWIPGALAFDGKRTAVLRHADIVQDREYPFVLEEAKGKKKMREAKDGEKGVVFDGGTRKSLDMGANSFCIEAVLRLDAAGGRLVAKREADAGYALGVSADGKAELQVGGRRIAGPALPAKTWFHILVEVDRGQGKARFHLDGKTAVEAPLGLDAGASLANKGDLVVGEGLVGAIDFLRIARSTLAESQTDIAELYAWEFDGPHLRDFLGGKPRGRRDAGAIEGF